MDVNLLFSLSLISFTSATKVSLPDSCHDQCEVGRIGNCFCNNQCRRHGDCCPDYRQNCERRVSTRRHPGHNSQESCQGRCSSGRHGSCFCNSHCERHGDCCHDYIQLCSNSTRQQRRQQLPSLSANASLSEVVSIMWDQDTARVPRASLTLNYQGVATYRGLRDRAPRPLFAYFDEEFLSRPTYEHFRRLLDNYNPDVNVTEVMTLNISSEIDDFVNVVVLSNPMMILNAYFRQRGIIEDRPEALAYLLRQLWFHPYNRGSRDVASSSGFEHVFVGETRRSSVTGFHNWIQFYLEEKKGNLNYRGYLSKEEPWLLRAQFTWKGKRKRGGSIFVGVSPEFELAVYTLCMVVESNRDCHLNLLGLDLNIKTFDVRSVPGLQVASAFVAF